MKPSVQLWDWEKDILRHLLYTAPEGDSEFLSLRQVAKAAGHGFIHLDKLNSFSKKLVTLGYGQSKVRDIQIPSIDVNFKLNASGRKASSELARALEYKSPSSRLGPVTWATIAAVVAACAAIVSALAAMKVY